MRRCDDSQADALGAPLACYYARTFARRPVALALHGEDVHWTLPQRLTCAAVDARHERSNAASLRGRCCREKTTPNKAFTKELTLSDTANEFGADREYLRIELVQFRFALRVQMHAATAKDDTQMLSSHAHQMS